MIGRLIDGRYQIKSRIARGGMATVYLATDLRLERRVAVKVMHGHLADDSAFKARFVQEARSAARLAHPNVVNVFDQGQEAEMAYMVMEYLPGMTLRDLLKDFGKLTPEQTVDIMDAVLRGLNAAHESGILHRDLKPENVLLADDGRIKLGDFGLARATSANTASGQALLGTIAYLSPELLTRGEADARSDLYAAGIMMFEMLTGEQPFTGEQPMQVAYQHANSKVPAPSSKNAAVPVELDAIVAWATARNPEKRPESAQAMLDQLLEAEKNIRPASSASELSTQQTMIMPAGMMMGNDDETRVINTGALEGLSKKTALDNPVVALRDESQSRRTRGLWLFIGVLILALLGGGTGWYFGSGPGSMTAIPSVAGLTPEAATAVLAEKGLTSQLADENSATMAKGKVIGTDPDEGQMVANGARVTIRVSIGPKILTMPAFTGMTADRATKTATDMGLVVKDPIKQFDAQVAVNLVISALAADGTALPATYPEGSAVQFVVSLGPIPSVANMTVQEATNALQAVGLVVGATSEDFSDTVAKGKVISVSAPEGAVVPGTNVTLHVSKGPDLVAVPNLIGMSIEDAIAKLESVGLTFSTDVDKELWPSKAVRSQNPGAGEQIKRGSSVTISNR